MLDAADKRRLRQRAHRLKPVVLVGQHGVTEAVVAEVDRALTDHELVKVRFRGVARGERDATMGGLAERLGADVVTAIGSIGVFHRENPDPKRKRSAP